MLTAWVVFLALSFSVSVLAMTYIQVRAASKHGWFGMWQRPIFDTYWRHLSLRERAFLWPGLAAFAMTFVAATLWWVAGPAG